MGKGNCGGPWGGGRKEAQASPGPVRAWHLGPLQTQRSTDAHLLRVHAAGILTPLYQRPQDTPPRELGPQKNTSLLMGTCPWQRWPRSREACQQEELDFRC